MAMLAKRGELSHFVFVGLKWAKNLFAFSTELCERLCDFIAFRFLPLVEMTVLYMFCKIDSDTVISTEWRNLVFLFLLFS